MIRTVEDIVKSHERAIDGIWEVLTIEFGDQLDGFELLDKNAGLSREPGSGLWQAIIDPCNEDEAEKARDVIAGAGGQLDEMWTVREEPNAIWPTVSWRIGFRC